MAASRFFDSVTYTETEYAEVNNRLQAEGIIVGIGGEGAASAPGGLVVRIAPFEALIQGFWYQNAANVDLVIPANTSGTTRTDTVVARLDRVNNVITVVLVPNGPAPTRTPGGTWELLLYSIAVPSGAGAFTLAMLTDQRQTTNCGYTGGGISSPNRPLPSRTNVDVSSPFDRDTGLWWPGANSMEMVAGGVMGVSLSTATLQLGTIAPLANVWIGRAGVTTTIFGDLSVQGNLTGTINTTAPINVTLASAVSAAFNANVISGPGLFSVSVADGQVAYINLFNISATKQAVVALSTAAGQFLGGSGDLNIYTTGSGAGGIIFGTSAARRMTLTTDSRIHMGTSTSGLGRLNVYTMGQGAMDGVVVYNANPAFYLNLSEDSSGNGVIGANGQANILIQPSGGKVTFGGSARNAGRVNILQGAGTAAEGLNVAYGGGTLDVFIDASGHVNLQGVTTGVQLMYTAAAFVPTADFGAHLGQASRRWATIYGLNMILAGGATFAGALSGITNISMAGTLTGVTNLTIGGALSGVTSITMSGALSGATGISAANVNTTGNITAGAWLVATVFCVPATDNTGHCGTNGNMWAEVWTYTAFKPGGGTWATTSDDRTKHPDFRPFNDGLDTVMQLSPTYYRYNGTYGTPADQEYVGFRAQELRKVAPEMVGSQMMRLDPSDEDMEEEEILTVDTTRLEYMLVNAVKELAARVQALEQQVAERSN